MSAKNIIQRGVLALGILTLAGCGSSESPSTAENQSPDSQAIPDDRMLPTPDQVAEQESQERSDPSGEYIGTWAVEDDDGDIFNIVIFKGGKAVTNFSKGPTGARGEFGEWVMEDDHIRLAYDSGWKDILLKDENGYMKLGYAPGITLNDQPSNEDEAEKVTGPVAPYIGVWYRKDSVKEKQPWFLSLKSDRSAQSTDSLDAVGQWEVHGGGRIEITWPNGNVTSLMPKKGTEQLVAETTKDKGGKQLYAGELALVTEQMGGTPEEAHADEDPESMDDVSLEPMAPENS